MDCCEIPFDAPCALSDSIMVEVANLLGLAPEDIDLDLSHDRDPPRVVVKDLGQVGTSTRGDTFSTSTRRFQIWFYACSKKAAHDARNTIMEDRTGLPACDPIAQEGYGKIVQQIPGPVTEVGRHFKAELDVRLLVHKPD